MAGDGVRNPYDDTALLADIADVQAAVDANGIAIADLDADVVLLQADVTDILAIADGLPTLASVVGSTTTTVIDTEYDLYINNAPLGVFKPILMTVNFLNQTAGETVILRQYRRDTDGGVWSLFDESLPIIGVQSPVLRGINMGPNRFGIRITIERTGGAARAYPFAAFYEI
jgi:NAD(P)-dependent dehydrogenase (short-subunit alcohol dehydrogenase family)